MARLDSRRWRCAHVSVASVGEGVGLLYSSLLLLVEEDDEEETSADVYIVCRGILREEERRGELGESVRCCTVEILVPVVAICLFDADNIC